MIINYGEHTTVSIPIGQVLYFDTINGPVDIFRIPNPGASSFLDARTIAIGQTTVVGPFNSLALYDIRCNLGSAFYDIRPNVVSATSVLPSQTGNAGKTLATDGTSAAWVATGQVNTALVPNPLGTANPGSGTAGAMGADAVLPMPGLAQLADVSLTGITTGQVPAWNATTGKFGLATPNLTPTPLYATIDNGMTTLPRGHLDDSDSYGQTPASGVEHFTYFRADKSITINTIRFQTAGKAAATSTVARVGLYTVSGGAKTLVASCANKTTFAGTYSAQTCALTAGYVLVSGTIYAIGILQVATTPASLFGMWFNPAYMGATPALAQATGSGKTDLVASSTDQNTSNFPIYYELVA